MLNYGSNRKQEKEFFKTAEDQAKHHQMNDATTNFDRRVTEGESLRVV